MQIALILTVIVVSSGSISTAVNAQSGFSSTDESTQADLEIQNILRHYYVDNRTRTWQDARDYCKSIGADLITYGFRNSTIRKYILTNLIPISAPEELISFWIGATDLAEEGAWEWIDGVELTPENSFFHVGEPNNIAGNQHCGQLFGYNHKMDDNACIDLKRVICEVPNECVEPTKVCHPNAYCVDHIGSYSCYCENGYTGNGTNCMDIDECDPSLNTCHDDATCTNTDGSFTCTCKAGFSGDGTNCIDIDECSFEIHDCDDSHGICTNMPGSFSCKCPPGYEGDGRNCTLSLVIFCSATEMRLSMPVRMANRYSADENTMHLNEKSCKPQISSDNDSYIFVVSGKLGSICGTKVRRNATHLIYNNEVRSFPDPNSIVFTGSTLKIPFSCAFQAVGHLVTLNYTALIDTTTINMIEGSGRFQLTASMFLSDFETPDTRQTFSTTDFIYILVGFDTEDPDLKAVLRSCWATPTFDPRSEKRYDLIDESCAISEAVSGTLKMVSNGESNEARFEVQVFRFTDENKLYIHCEVSVCNSANRSCVPNCAPPRKWKASLGPLHSRRARQAEDKQILHQVIGPFYRTEPDKDCANTSGINVVILGGVLGGVVLLLIVIILAFLAKFYIYGPRTKVLDSPAKHSLTTVTKQPSYIKGNDNVTFRI